MRFLRLSSLTAAFAAAVFLLTSVRPSLAVIRDGGVDPANLGQGGWLYIMSQATNKLGGNVASVTNEDSLFGYLKSVGFNYVIVKAATSNTMWFGTYSFPQFTSALVNKAHAHGLLIFASNRSWGNDIPGEIDIADQLFNLGADGYIWDAESEWETSAANPWITNGPAQAWQLASTIRAHWPNKFLAHNPYDTLYLHSSFPFKEFGYWSDAVMPQVYHHSTTQGNAIAAIHWMDINYKKFQDSLSTLPNTNINGTLVIWTNAIKPLVLMRDVYGATFSMPYPPIDVRNFLDYLVADPNCVTTGGYRGSDYFRSELHDTNQWAYMKAATIGVFPNVVNNLVIDDPRATRVGTWIAVKTIDATTSTVTFSGATGTDTNSFGTNYLTKTKGTGSAYVQFTPNVLTAGDYQVYHWHPFRADASATVPFIVISATGTNTVIVNEQTNNGDWSLLGQFNFAAGSNGCIRITDGFSEAGDVALADGMKLTFVPPPVISLVTATNILDTTATVTWNTDLAANSVVEFGLTTNYGTVISNATTVTSHSVNLSSLAASTTYHFRVKSRGTSSVMPVSPDVTFTTLPAGVVPNLIIDNPAANVVGVWSTGTSSSDKFGTDYRFKNGGTGAAYLQYVPSLAAMANYRVYEWHSIGSNRTTNAPYIINSKYGSQTIGVNQTVNGGQWNLLGTFIFDAGGAGSVQIADSYPDTSHVVIADAIQFSYDSPVQFLITNVTVSPRQTGAIIMWLTSFGATTQIQYGTTTNYGSSTAIDNTLLTSHLVWLSGLNSNTVYNFRAVSTYNGTQYISTNYTFTTDPSITLIGLQASYTGVWIPENTAPDKFSATYLYASTTTGADTAQAVYRPTITLTGLYDVYIWYPASSSRSASAPVTVSYPGGGFTTTVNMTTNGGGWRLLGAGINLPAGTNAFVRLGNGSGESGKTVVSDAIRFTYSAGQDANYFGTVPSWWSTFYFGGAISPSQDTDSDGYSAFSEYVLGTDPTSANSKLRLAPQAIANGGVSLIFSPFQASRLYQVQASDSIAFDANWVTLSNLPVSINTNGQGVINVTNQPGKGKFLRLSVQLTP